MVEYATNRGYLASKKKFLNELNDLLLYSQPTKTKYERLYDSDDSSGVTRVFLQRKTRNIVKVHVSVSGFGSDDPVSLTVDDPDMLKLIINLPSFNDMKYHLIEMEDHNTQSRLYDKLKYNV